MATGGFAPAPPPAPAITPGGAPPAWAYQPGKAPGTLQQAPFDPGAYGMGVLLDRLNNPNGTFVPGSGGSFINNSGARAAAQQGYNVADANATNVYGQIAKVIADRNPQIQQDYAGASQAALQSARQNAINTRAGISNENSQAAQAAALMGLGFVPPATQRASAVAEGFLGRNQNNADSWNAFNQSSGQRAVERNNAVGNAFRSQGNQQHQHLAQLLQQTLAGLVDRYTAGSAGKYVGGLTPSNQIAIANSLIGYQNKQFGQDLNTAKFVQKSNPPGF